MKLQQHLQFKSTKKNRQIITSKLNAKPKQKNINILKPIPSQNQERKTNSYIRLTKNQEHKLLFPKILGENTNPKTQNNSIKVGACVVIQIETLKKNK